MWTLTAILAFITLILICYAVAYFLKRKTGKSQFATAAVAAIASIWCGYVSLLTINWPAVAIVLILKLDPTLALQYTSLSWWQGMLSFVVALLLSFFIFRIASIELEKNNLPINASAMEIEEMGRSAGIIELANAHIRFRLSGKMDRPLTNPGENLYRLPPIPRQVDWNSLSLSLLLQLESNLNADTLSFIYERKFYSLIETNFLDSKKSTTWIVLAAHSNRPDSEILNEFETHFFAPINKQHLDRNYVACVKSNAPRDEKLKTNSGITVRFISEFSLIERSLDFTEYATNLVRRFEHRQIPGTNYTLKDCFVEPHARETRPYSAAPLISTPSPHEKPIALLSALNEWAKKDSLEHISVVGEFGQGKSTALLAFCVEWARRWSNGDRNSRIPLLIELRGKSPRRQAPDRFLAEWGDRYGLRGEALLNLVQAGRAILIFEGFDEVQDAGLRYDRFEQFKALWSFSYPNAKIIFTGRPNFFLDTDERERLLRNNPSAQDSGLESSKILTLSFLDIPAISKALEKYPTQVRSEILEQCKTDQAFLDIAKRPSMLPVIGNQWDAIKLSLIKEGGITSAAIISHFIDFLYSRKEADQDKLGDFQLLHRKVRHYFTQRVAWCMAVEHLSNTIDRERFVHVIEEAFQQLDAELRVDAPDNTDDVAAATSIAILREKFKNRPNSEIVAAIATEVRTNGLLVPDPAGGRDNLYFPHKQYYEFVLSETFVDYLTKNRKFSWAANLPNSQMMNVLSTEPVALYFASGLLNLTRYSIADFQSKITRFNNFFISLLITMCLPILDNRFLESKAFNWAFRNNYGLGIKNQTNITRHVPFKYRFLAGSGMSSFMFVIPFIMMITMAGEVTATAIHNLTPACYLMGGDMIAPRALADNEIASNVSPLSKVFGFFLEKNPNTFVRAPEKTFILSGMISTIIFMLASTSIFLSSILVLRSHNWAKLRIEVCYLAMEIYRYDKIPFVINANGLKANAALVKLIDQLLPRESLEFRDDTVRNAERVLNIYRMET